MKVQQMTNSNGNTVKNQFTIRDDEGSLFFQSYNTMIAKISVTGEVTLSRGSWDYSNTTGKYRNIFLGEDKRATQAKIDSGEYQLVGCL